MSDNDTPMEAGPLHVDGSNDERVRADLIERNRRLMRLEYQRTNAYMHPLPPSDPVLEPSHFAPLEPTEPKPAGFWSREFVAWLIWAALAGVTVGLAIGALAWRAGQ